MSSNARDSEHGNQRPLLFAIFRPRRTGCAIARTASEDRADAGTSGQAA
jgi:hypothetical protein